MTTVISSKGVRPNLNFLDGVYILPTGEVKVVGFLWSFNEKDDGSISSRVGLQVLDLVNLRKRLALCSSFPWIKTIQVPTTTLEIESRICDGDHCDRFAVLDGQGKSLRYQEPGDCNYWNRGYGSFLQEEARKSGFKLDRDVLDNLFNPLEEKLRQHFF